MSNHTCAMLATIVLLASTVVSPIRAASYRGVLGRSLNGKQVPKLYLDDGPLMGGGGGGGGVQIALQTPNAYDSRIVRREPIRFGKRFPAVDEDFQLVKRR